MQQLSNLVLKWLSKPHLSLVLTRTAGDSSAHSSVSLGIPRAPVTPRAFLEHREMTLSPSAPMIHCEAPVLPSAALSHSLSHGVTE